MDENEKHSMALIEAVLYVTGKPIDLKTLSSLTKVKDKSKLKALIECLIERYKNNESSIEIVELEDERYMMQLKPDYIQYVKKFLTRPLLSHGPLRTLSFIAFKQPIDQAYVVKVRGKLAYKHIKLLLNMGLIKGEKFGRTKLLKTTKLFADYFNLSQDLKTMKKQLSAMFEKIKKSSQRG
ncbi:MAG: SMC-Scp complex subunit ScpB [Candidatus Bathyarchaeia archaeon]